MVRHLHGQLVLVIVSCLLIDPCCSFLTVTLRLRELLHSLTSNPKLGCHVVCHPLWVKSLTYIPTALVQAGFANH